MGACCSDAKIEVPYSLPPHPRPPSPVRQSSSVMASAPDSAPAHRDLLLWMDSEVREGDGLLLALSQLLPTKQLEVAQVLAQSLELRKDPVDWTAYQAYLDRRRRVCTAIWTELLMQRRMTCLERERILEKLRHMLQRYESQEATLLLAQLDSLREAKEEEIVDKILTFQEQLVSIQSVPKVIPAVIRGKIVAGLLIKRQQDHCLLHQFLSIWKLSKAPPKPSNLTAIRHLMQQFQATKSEFQGLKAAVSEHFQDFTPLMESTDLPVQDSLKVQILDTLETDCSPITYPEVLNLILEEHLSKWGKLMKLAPEQIKGFERNTEQLEVLGVEQKLRVTLETCRDNLSLLLAELSRRTPAVTRETACQTDELRDQFEEVRDQSEEVRDQSEEVKSQVEEVKSQVEEVRSQVEEVRSQVEEVKGLTEDVREVSSSPLPLLRRLLQRVTDNNQSMTSVSFHLWKQRSVPSTIPTFPSEMSISRCSSPDFRADFFVLKQSIFQRNILLQVQEDQGKAKMLPTVQLAKFFEEVMKKKLEADVLDLRAKRWPKAIPAFIFDYLIRLFGLRKLAIGAVNQLMPSLERCCSEGLSFAVLFARLAQVFHESPTPYFPALFITREMEEFDSLVGKLQKDSASAKEPKHYSMTGGEARLSDVLPYVYSRFDCDKLSGRALIRQLKPAGVSDTDFELFHLGFKLTKLAIQPSSFYALLGSQDGSESGLVTALRRSLDLWTSTDKLLEALRVAVGNAPVTKASLTAKIGPKLYEKYCKKKEFVVSKYAFLISLVDVYQAKESAFLAKAKSLAQEYGEVMTLPDFTQLLRKLDPSIDPERITKLFQRALGNSTEFQFAVPLDLLVETLARYPVGSLARPPFCLRELAELPLEDAYETVESPAPSPSLKRIKGRTASDSRLLALFPKFL